MIYKLQENTNYYAEIVKLSNPVKHPNADKLLIWEVNGFNIITDLSYKEGDVCVYFPLECQINSDFLSYLNMFSDSTLNQNKDSKGYMHKSGRVRAIKLRDVLSEGIVIGFDNFAFWLSQKGYTVKRDIGVKFTDVDKLWICKKYVVQISLPKEERKTKGKVPKATEFLVDGQFAFHEKTPQLQREIYNLQPTDVISISVKVHGTSAVYANLLTKRKLSLFEKLVKSFVKLQLQEYTRMYSSRSVLKFIENKWHTKEQGFYNADVWGIVYEDVKDKIGQGYTLYGEIVGSVNGKHIQKGYDYSELLTDKTYQFLVYKITYTTPNSDVIELDWNQMYDYCKRHNLNVVPTVYYGQASVRFPYFQDSIEDWRKNVIDTLRKAIERQCEYCTNNVPFEGYVVRKEGNKPLRLKIKSAAFLVRESKQLDEGEADIEESN